MESTLIFTAVWRKFPRNQRTAEERRPTMSTQTEESSSAVLGLAASADLTGLPRKILDQQAIECYSGSDLGKSFEAENGMSISDAGSSSDFFSPGLAEWEETSLDYSPENTTFMPPSKKRSSKKKRRSGKKSRKCQRILCQ
ncbi:MAG: hypothetical protein GY696_09510 [Gammaproteobacteria bacterium]|nr:hypothetical protein [Gammaproteobacteria bacterium]